MIVDVNVKGPRSLIVQLDKAKGKNHLVQFLIEMWLEWQPLLTNRGGVLFVWLIEPVIGVDGSIGSNGCLEHLGKS